MTYFYYHPTVIGDGDVEGDYTCDSYQGIVYAKSAADVLNEIENCYGANLYSIKITRIENDFEKGE